MNLIILKTPEYQFLTAIPHTKLNKCLVGRYFGLPLILSCVTQCLDEILNIHHRAFLQLFFRK